MHYTLNLTSPVNHTDSNCLIGKVKCEGYGGFELQDNARYSQIIKAVGSVTVVQQLPNLLGFLLNLIRGESAILHDPVGEACWRAQSYIAGGINPLYPGTGRSTLDLARSNYACGEVINSRAIVGLLI
jgi:hypothetical protein